MLCGNDLLICLHSFCCHLLVHNTSIHLCQISLSTFFFPPVQALAEQMDAQNERLGWLNKHAPQILASPSVSPQSRDQHVGKLRVINLNWSKVLTPHPSSCLPHLTTPWKLSISFPLCFFHSFFTSFFFFFFLQVTHELLDKVGEVETSLQSHALFQDRMNRLTDWVVVTHQTIMTRGLSPGQAQVDHLNTSHEPKHLTENLFITDTKPAPKLSSHLLQALEASMKDRKKDLEDLLAHSIELQRRQQLLPQEKVPVSTVLLFNQE